MAVAQARQEEQQKASENLRAVKDDFINKINMLNNKIKSQQEEIVDLNGHLGQKEKTIEQRDRDIGQRDFKITELEKEIQNLKDLQSAGGAA